MIGRIYGKILTKFSISSFEYDYKYNEQRWAIIIKIVNPCILRSKFYRKPKYRLISVDYSRCKFWTKGLTMDLPRWEHNMDTGIQRYLHSCPLRPRDPWSQTSDVLMLRRWRMWMAVVRVLSLVHWTLGATSRGQPVDCRYRGCCSKGRDTKFNWFGPMPRSDNHWLTIRL